MDARLFGIGKLLGEMIFSRLAPLTPIARSVIDPTSHAVIALCCCAKHLTVHLSPLEYKWAVA